MTGEPVRIADGFDGELRYSYQLAARLGEWSLARTRDGYTLSAAVTWRDEVWSSRTPLALTLGLGPVEWHWPAVSDVSFDQASAGLTATVRFADPPEGTAPRGTRLDAPPRIPVAARPSS